MSTLMVFQSRHGCTEKAAHLLKDKLKDDITLKNLKKESIPDLAPFSTIIVGGSIHAGQVQGSIKKFCKQNLPVLMEKRVGLFLCCMEKGETAQKQFDEAFPQELRDHAIATGLFGGEFNLERMNFVEKAIIKKVAKVTESVSKLREDAIDRFAAEIS